MDTQKALLQLRFKYDMAIMEPYYMDVEFDFFDNHRYAGRILIVAAFSNDSIPCRLNCNSNVTIEVFKITDVLLDDENLIDLTRGVAVVSYTTFEMLENYINLVLKKNPMCIKRIMNQKYLNFLLGKN